MVTFVDLTFDPQTLADVDPTHKVVVTVRTNAGGAIFDSTGDKVFLGTYSQTLTAAETFAASLPVTNEATNPTAFQYAVSVYYMQTKPDGKSERKTWDSGWFSLTATSTLNAIVEEQYVPPTWMTTATATLQTYVDEAATSASEAAASAALADSYIVADLNTSDGQMEALIESPTSLTSAALSATFVTPLAKTTGTAVAPVPFVNVLDFGAVGDGVTDDSAAIQAAIDTKCSVLFPTDSADGVRSYMVSSPLTTAIAGQVIRGTNPIETYLLTPSGSTHDILRIKHPNVEVSNLHFRPGSASNKCIRVYAAWSNIHHCRFLAAVNGAGTAIYLDDVDPATAAVVPGAYIHHIWRNYIGNAGYAFEYGIYGHSSTNGQQANQITGNYFCGDKPIYITKGGGNVYRDNLFQSSTGTYGTPAGTAIRLAADVHGELITGNYFERYATVIQTDRLTNDYLTFDASGNHFDNNTTLVVSAGTRYYTHPGWQAYTPTTTGITLGNGTLTARWRQAGDTVQVSISVVLGSTSAITGDVSFSAPLTPAGTAGGPVPALTSANFLDAGAAVFPAHAQVEAGAVYVRSQAGAVLSSTVPFTWATNDRINVSVSYEIA